MNKRAKQRLIGVTAIVLVVVGALIFGTSQGSGSGAYSKTVSEVLEDDTLIGKQVQVSGPVQAGSWVAGAQPFAFEITDKEDVSGPRIRVVWEGPVPSAFGDGTIAIVKGLVGEDKSIAASSLITQCPSKYESATDALSVVSLLSSAASVEGKPVKVAGLVVAGTINPAGSGERFFITDEVGSADTIGVTYAGSLPSGMEDGSRVVVTGVLGDGDVLLAEDVALEETGK